MLTIIVPGDENFDEVAEEFVTVGDVELRFEHSLASMSKWESFWEKAFITKIEKTEKEMFWYIKAMCLNENPPEEIFDRLSQKNLLEIQAYIDAKMTGTTFPDTDGTTTQEIITAEVIYYWMVSLNIPFECQNWHLNRLIALIRVINIKNQPKKKLTHAEKQSAMANRKALNEARRAQMNSTG